MNLKSYLFEHKRNILSEKSITKSKLIPGDIVKFRYSGKEVNTPNPMVLVLNPNWKGHLHGLTLDYIPQSTLEKLYTVVKDTVATRLARLTGLNLPLIRADIRDPERFYYDTLKKFILINIGRKDSPYRKFTTTGITGIRKLDYRFKKMSKEKG